MSPECLNKDGPNRSHYFPRQNDIWSLGVILVNIITSSNPWCLAVSKNEHFAGFLKDKQYLRMLLPVSEEVFHLLLRIFELNPLRRISLPNLRKEIMAIKTFHAQESPIPSLPEHETPRHGKPQVYTVYTEEVPSSSDESSFSSESSSNSIQPSSLPQTGPTPLAELLEQGLQITPHQVTLPPRYSRWCGSSNTWDADTDSESDSGPVTPASVAVEPEVDVVVPELCLDGGLHEEEMPTPKLGHQPFISKAAAVMSPKFLARGFKKIRKEMIR